MIDPIVLVVCIVYAIATAAIIVNFWVSNKRADEKYDKLLAEIKKKYDL